MSTGPRQRLTEVDKTGPKEPALPGTSLVFRSKEITMNAKILYAATTVLALASSLALAGENGQPLTRAEVNKAWSQAAADGTLRKNDYDYDVADFKGTSAKSREEVLAELRAPRDPRLVGPLRNRSYNPSGTDNLRAPTVERAQVKAEVIAAIRDGTLRHTDYDDEIVAGFARRAPARAPAAVLATTGVASGR